MKRLLAYLFIVLGLGLVVSVKADDIRDFQIEGISVGDKILDHVSKKEYSKRKKREYKYKNIFATIVFENKKYLTYEKVRFHYKLNDKNRIIYGVEGQIYFPDKIHECLKKKENIVTEIAPIVSNTKRYNKTWDHWADKKGKSKVHQTIFRFTSGDVISIQCFDWSDEITKEKRWPDNLKVGVQTKDIVDFFKSLNK
jgi:hypothetical protein